MRTAPWATLALSAVCALLSGGIALLDGPSSSAVGSAAAARPGDRLPLVPMRQSKSDREPVKGQLAVVALTGEALSGTALRPLGAETDDGNAPVFGRLMIDGALRQEIDSALTSEAMEDAEELDDMIAALTAPGPEYEPSASAGATARTAPGVPLPPEKPAHAPLVNVPLPPSSPNAQRASLFAGAQPAEKPDTAKPSRLGFFSNMGVSREAETKIAALTPPPAASSRTPGVTVQTPFGIPYVLQTENVEAACLKPALLTLLRSVEKHYGQKAVLTSGSRDKGREGSLHRSCQAADIIVPGVEAQDLAKFARTLPGVGGVGTYCHPSMIHVDTGTPRDWHFGCGKSYFAMRDGSAGWGAVPERTALAGRSRQTITE